MSVLAGRRILVVDDDVQVLHLLESIFSRAGAEVYAAESGAQAVQLVMAHPPDLVVLDIMMADLDGFQTCAQIQQRSKVPIIFLTALTAERDIVRGLEHGAVDYVTKPFSPRVLVARAAAALRQVPPPRPAEALPPFDDGYLHIDPVARQVSVRGEAVALTSTEYELLIYLIKNADRVVSCAEILARVWGEGYQDSTNYVHAYIHRLRQKLEPNPGKPTYLRNVWGRGYGFGLPDPA